MSRSYADAVAALNTLQSNFAVVNAIRKSGRGMNQQAIPEMIDWCRKIGYEPSDFNRLKIIHIAGTKGKGSTGAFTSSILAQYLPSSSQPRPLLRKIGLYTSPHLRFVRERIQINNEPLSEELFAKYFFETWDRMEEAAKARKLPADVTAKPVYFRFLTLMAFHTYMSEGVDTAVIECGIGGEYDSTNIITAPTVTGITSLGIDHVAMLGSTIEEIAWHKAGIMKTGAPAFTSPQLPEAFAVLRSRAAEKSVSLSVAVNNSTLSTIKLGLAADFQIVNASLAIAVTFTHLETIGYSMMRTRDLGSDGEKLEQENFKERDVNMEQHKGHMDNSREKDLHGEDLHHSFASTTLPPEFVRGLQSVRWPGRCETRDETNITWHIDGGHTLESIEAAGKWFASQTPHFGPNKPSRILIFNQQTRDASALAHALHRTLAAALQTKCPFSHAIFCTNVTFGDVGYSPDLVSVNTNVEEVKQLDVQKRLAETWRAIDANAQVEVVGTIEEAVEMARKIAKEDEETKSYVKHRAKVLVTGSLHLVGGFLDVVERRK